MIVYSNSVKKVDLIDKSAMIIWKIGLTNIFILTFGGKGCDINANKLSLCCIFCYQIYDYWFSLCE